MYQEKEWWQLATLLVVYVAIDDGIPCYQVALVGLYFAKYCGLQVFARACDELACQVLEHYCHY